MVSSQVVEASLPHLHAQVPRRILVPIPGRVSLKQVRIIATAYQIDMRNRVRSLDMRHESVDIHHVGVCIV